MTAFRLTSIEDYKSYIGREAVERIRAKAEALRGLHMVHVNSTFYGGGVAEILSSLTLLLNSIGIKAGWRVIQGRPDFFSITKKMHNALQGGDINLTDLKTEIYEEVIYENSVRLHLNHDLVVVHDPQPLPLIQYLSRSGPAVWRCHLDMTEPNPELWGYLRGFVEQYDAAIFSLPEYRQDLPLPQRFFFPAIDPFSTTNRSLNGDVVNERLRKYGIPTDLPLVTQVSRFDRWKDPQGVVETYRKVAAEAPCTLVLVGNVATDDPEGQEVFESICSCANDRIIVLSCQDSALVNALQCRSAVILQKSLREGFGLTVTEAMWKGTPVIGGNVGGIRHQITDGENGFLVNSVDEAAERLMQLLSDAALREDMGRRARESVRRRFLLSRLLEDYLDLAGGFETRYILQPQSVQDRSGG